MQIGIEALGGKTTLFEKEHSWKNMFKHFIFLLIVNHNTKRFKTRTDCSPICGDTMENSDVMLAFAIFFIMKQLQTILITEKNRW